LDVPTGLDQAERGGEGEEGLLDVDRAPPGQRARAEGDAGEGEGGEQEGGVPTQARQVLLTKQVRICNYVPTVAACWIPICMD